jgi:hypothetical protein
MLACKLLSIPFLWVDCLCILQDDKEKHSQIRNMHRIFHFAKVTLVAASSINANAGLPGVRAGCRAVKQLKAQVRGLFVGLKLGSLEKALSKAVWKSRAWTLQESLLFKRKLIFTDQQVYFSCSHGICSEDFHEPIHRVKPPRQNEDLRFFGGVYTFTPCQGLNLHMYHRIVESYSSRMLSYEKDVLNAFEALSTAISRTIFCGTSTIFGMPLCILDIAILWKRGRPTAGIKRRTATDTSFPSWSWAGWVGKVELCSNCNLSETSITRLKWIDGSDGVTPLCQESTGRPVASWPGWSDWKRHRFKNGLYEYFLRYGDETGVWYCHPVDPCSYSTTPLDTKSGLHLHLLADIAIFKVVERERCEFDLDILDSEGFVVGHIRTDMGTRGVCAARQSFLKVSQTTLSDNPWQDPAWDPQSESFKGKSGAAPCNPRAYDESRFPKCEFDRNWYDWRICWCLYNVLMVEWRDGIAFRMGVGMIHIHAFDNASPEWRKIILG